MAERKRKYDLEPVWTYTDAVTNREHKIHVFTAINKDGRHGYRAEVKTPIRLDDWDENLNVLMARVFALCAAGTNVEWTRYIMVTISKEGFPKELFPADGWRRSSSITVTVEGFEITALPDVGQVWRGTERRSHRFNSQAKPDWPPVGRTDRGMIYHILDTPENQAAVLDAINALGNESYTCFEQVIKQRARKHNGIRKDTTSSPQEATCSETSPGPSSALSAPSAAASTA